MTAILALLSRNGSSLVIAAVLIASSAAIYGVTALRIDRLVKEARQAEQNVWLLKIEEMKRLSAEEAVAQARRSAEVEAQAAERIAATERNYTELEKDNAVLPDSSECGLGAKRVRLLNR